MRRLLGQEKDSLRREGKEKEEGRNEENTPQLMQRQLSTTSQAH